ncbi:uracil permease [Bacillus carboniphilus]|uniref:Uracil permease n=1 Tax=Bacillus carboniphilus TaxID=86663 RepID=A0ABN0WBA6_9BACI
MNNNQKPVLDVREVPKVNQWIILSIQHLFAMFGATILVPMLVGLDPAVALISSGLGTLAYLLITRGRIPAYLGSSFAFIAPIISAKTLEGPEAVMFGCFVAGLVYGVVSLLIRWLGVNWLFNVLPPIVVGPVIMVIGLGLAPTAVGMAMNDADGNYSLTHIQVALITLAITIIAAIFFRGFFKLIPVLIGVVGGYITAYFYGLVNLQPIMDAKWFQLPELLIPYVTYTPTFSWTVVGLIAPVAFVTLAEHTGHQMVLSKVVGRNFIKKPGLHRSIMGDGVATMIASLVGGPPNTTYGENIGVLAITRVFSVFIIGGAAVTAIMFGMIGKVSAVIASIPTAVMGGVSILLFGIIASSGLRMMVDNKVDLSQQRNLIIPSVILVIGIGGAYIQLENFTISAMALAALSGILLNQILPGKTKVDIDEMFDADTEDQTDETEKLKAV